MTDDPAPDPVEHDGPSVNRRRLLAALGTGALTQGLAGCSFLGSETRTFVAILVRIALDPGAALEYLLLDFQRRTRTFEETIAGNDVSIEVTFNLLVYQLMQGLFGFGILVVPQPDIAGISIFGFADKSIPAIVEDPEQRTQIVNQLGLTDAPVEAVEDPRLLDQRQVEGSDVYQSEVNVYRYGADLRTADDEGQDVLLFELGKGTGVEGATDSVDKIHTGIGRSGVLEAPNAPVVGEEEGSAFTPELVSQMAGAHDTILGNLEETSPDQLTTQTTVQDQGEEEDDDEDTTTAESSGEASLSLSQEADGPFLADGRDGTTVTIEATDAEGNAIEQDDLDVALFTGDDTFRLPSIQSRGPGEYAVSVNSEVKGTATVRAEVEEFELREHRNVEFVPGPPDHFWITSNEPPGPEGPEPTASFNLLLKDQYGNLVPPDRAQYRFRSENSAATFSQQIDREKELVHVEVRLDEPPAPDGEFWSAFEVEVFEENSGYSRGTRVEFPVVDTSFRPVRVDGQDAYALELSSVNFTPLQVFDIFVPFDEERFEILETRPGEVEAEVERTPDGVRIRGEALDDEGGGDGDDGVSKTDLGVIIFRVDQELGLREINVDVPQILFRNYDESVFSFPFLGKLLITEFTEVCLKIWMIEGCDEETINSDIETLKNVFDKSYLNCCPAVLWNINRMTIPADSDDPNEMDWDQIDGARPSDHLTPGFGEDDSGDVPVPDLSVEQKRLVENYNDSDCINVYYVPDMDGGTIGQGGTELSETDDKWSFDTNGQRDANWAFVSNEAGGKTLPHEIGHVFNLKHPPKPEDDEDVPESNIMLQTAQDADPGRFSEEQCDRLQDIMD